MFELSVELWAAPIPILGRFADHHWLVVQSMAGVNRWEVWQKKQVVRTAWGYLHCDLMPPKASLGYGPGRHIMTWVGGDARYLQQRIESAPTLYPWIDRYHLYPGPNSNTFVEWALGDAYSLRYRAPGAWYARFAGSRSRERSK